MNHWLDSTVKTYTDHFGLSDLPVVWDVGSRDGRDGHELGSRISSTGEMVLVCVEANPAQAEVIRRDFPRALVYGVAVSDEAREMDFMVYKGDEGAVGSSSLDLGWKGDDLEGDIIKVQAVRLEDIMGGNEVDVMKIDVEGYSLKALEGMGDRLRQVKVYHIETEVWAGSDELVEVFMRHNGYLLTDVMEQYGGMPDMVFVRI